MCLYLFSQWVLLTTGTVRYPILCPIQGLSWLFHCWCQGLNCLSLWLECQSCDLNQECGSSLLRYWVRLAVWHCCLAIHCQWPVVSLRNQAPLPVGTSACTASPAGRSLSCSLFFLLFIGCARCHLSLEVVLSLSEVRVNLQLGPGLSTLKLAVVTCSVTGRFQ